MKNTGFTLAEVLIVLAIIGIVAAITLPSVIANYEDKQYNVARLKALKTFGESGKMVSINNKMGDEENAKDFANNVLSKYLKITKVCDTAAECDFPDKIKPSSPSSNKLDSDNLKTWANLCAGNITANNLTKTSDVNLSTYLMTNDGFSAKLFYNPNCIRNSHENPRSVSCRDQECDVFFVDSVCMNVIYDMNGATKPNHVGEDVGIVTVFWSGLRATAVAPGIPQIYSINSSAPNKVNSEAANYCAAKSTKRVQYSLPTVEELASLYLNVNLSNMGIGHVLWSSSSVQGMSDKYWAVGYNGLNYCASNRHSAQTENTAWCVRR